MALNVVLISPGFPADNGHFTQALHRIPGVRVLGVGDQPVSSMDPEVRDALDEYLPVADLWNEGATVQAVRDWLGSLGVQAHRVECLWEVGVVLAARMREALDAPGLRVEQANAFRDKETMKSVLDAHGVRTPHHYRATTSEQVQEAAGNVGYPLIIKPIDGAGSADTYVVRSEEELGPILSAVKHVPEVSVEEFVEGDEFTYDAILANGETLFENVAWYRPKPLVARQNPWISPQAVCLSDIRQDDIAKGVELGRRALKALGYETGMAHMEWYASRSTGEAIFGEVGARAPGGRLSHGMNFSCDGDVFQLWAEAITSGRTEQSMEKRYNAALIFKRAEGSGSTITRVEGLDRILSEQGEHIPVVDLVGVGEPRRDWTQVVTGDGWMVARHMDLQSTLDLADRISRDVRLHCDGMTTTADMGQPPRRVALLGPQHESQTLRGALDQLGAEGPMVLASAGWEERESETGALEEHLGQDVVSLGLWPAAEDVFRADPSVREVLFCRFDRMRELGGIYRVRLAAELEALRELLRRTDPANPDDLVGPALGPAFDSLIALDAHHTARVHELNQEIFEEACAKGEVQRVRDELRPTLEGAGTLLVAGGHVGILYNRMRLFGVLDSLAPAAPVVGWSGGAMVLTERILLFHDSPPQGAGDAEIYGPGFGIAKGVVCLPHASRRLKLEDRARVALLARRLAPAQVAALDDGQCLLQESVLSESGPHGAGRWRLQRGARELQVSGEVLEPASATKGVPA